MFKSLNLLTPSTKTPRQHKHHPPKAQKKETSPSPSPEHVPNGRHHRNEQPNGTDHHPERTTHQHKGPEQKLHQVDPALEPVPVLVQPLVCPAQAVEHHPETDETGRRGEKHSDHEGDGQDGKMEVGGGEDGEDRPEKNRNDLCHCRYRCCFRCWRRRRLLLLLSLLLLMMVVVLLLLLLFLLAEKRKKRKEKREQETMRTYL